MDEIIEERRGSLRVDLEAERIRITIRGDRDFSQSDDGICLDLSRHGMLLEYRSPLDLGTLLEITFNPGKNNENTVRGQVCRCTSCNEHSFHIALQLLYPE